MNDLISRKAVLDLINKRITERKPDKGSMWIRNDEAIDIQSEVESLPVAYDVDKIVEQMEKLQQYYIYSITDLVKLSDVMKILKGAVKDE